MQLTSLARMTRKFLSLPPTPGMMANAVRFSARYFTGRFAPRVTYSPLSIGFYITYACNLTCQFCWNTTINQKEFMKLNMDVEEFERILTHPRLRNAFRVSFVGGEPTSHPDIFEFLRLCKKYRKLTMIPSNGLYIKKRLEDFRKAPLTTLQVSLYDGEIDEQLDNVAALMRVPHNIDVALARYVTTEPDTWAFMEEVVRMARDVGVKSICFQNFVPTGPETAHLCIYDDNEDVMRMLKEFRRKHGREFNLTMPSPLLRDVSKRFCFDLYTVIFVGKGGQIAPCSSIVPPGDKFGNIWDDDFWNNSYFSGHRSQYNSHFPYDEHCEFCYESSGHERSFI